ncbi:hypothetical protein KUTeg_019729 [Tegillarca granosa]|uniref:Uncharacterized protein n=1 Tax=Tegillarca granosa TaxID=220873 RepID=A0ABQ9EDD8_TEGGR|nr:hypothetical protein KUTeg_019729 [Tegillarca granosa]
MCRCLLLFLKLKYDYYQMCSTTITSLLKKLVQSGENTDNKDLLQQMDSLDLLTSSPRDSPNRSFSRKKNSGSSSPKTKNKHNTFTSSFLSLFERKNSPDEKSSAFYVDLNQPASIQSESDGSSHMSTDNQSDILVQIGLDPVQEEKLGEQRVPSMITPQIIGPTDTLNSSWSAIHDTDDLSDDSSCGGGEQFFAVGLDLVHALDSKDGSSDEDGGKSSGYEHPKSTDGHLKDKQSTNTWPPKQLWSQTNMIGGDMTQEKPVNQSHRPVSMQWSDPLANRNVWSSSGKYYFSIKQKNNK